MGFIPSDSRSIQGVGNPDADIMIIGDCPDRKSFNMNRVFAGPDGSVLEGAFHQAGLIRADAYITYLVKDMADHNKLWNRKSKKYNFPITDHVEILREEIKRVSPNIIITLGDAASYPFTGHKAVLKSRGYIFVSEKMGLKVLPTLHPRDLVWANYVERYYLAHDLKKAKDHSRTKAPQYDSIDIRTPRGFDECCSALEYYMKQDLVSFDLEVINYTVACISYCSDPSMSTSIPYDNNWTVEQETELWRLTAKLLENPNIAKVGQNLIFDNHFLAQQHGIFVKGSIKDTMIAHSIMYPDFLKGLGFLASVYCNVPFWKDMVNFKSIKKED